MKKSTAATVARYMDLDAALAALAKACTVYCTSKKELIAAADAAIKAALFSVAQHGNCSPLQRIISAVLDAGAKALARRVASNLDNYTKHVFGIETSALVYIDRTRSFACVRSVWKAIRERGEASITSALDAAPDFSTWLASQAKKAEAPEDPEAARIAARDAAVQNFTKKMLSLGYNISEDILNRYIADSDKLN